MTFARTTFTPVSLIAATLMTFTAGCMVGGNDDSDDDTPTTGVKSDAISGSDIANLALANVGGTACGQNTLGGTNFYSSCTGNGGQPEYWCSDFARWVWNGVGIDTSELSAAAGSFGAYGHDHGTFSSTPSVGAAVVFDYDGNDYADHVAIVTQVNNNGTIETVSGDWNGQNGSEATFSRTSHVILNSPAYNSTEGTSPGVMGMTISGYIMPSGMASGGTTTGGGTTSTGDPSCSVQSDALLHCTNTIGAALYASAKPSSTIVNHLRTSPSWFTCWGTGTLHAGGNTTWYYTEGDDNSKYGWIPAVNLNTTSAFDANPTAMGLKKCN